MKAAKRDVSGVFRLQPTGRNPRPEPNTALISPSGFTFSSASYVAPFTEVRIKLHNPASGSVRCSGVVVDCQGDRIRRGYTVAVAFLNVPSAVKQALLQADGPVPSRLILRPAPKPNRDPAIE